MVALLIGFAQTFKRSALREELDTYYRMRRSVWFVIALMVAMSAFWTTPWAWVGFFLILATYSAWACVRMGFVCGVSFAGWFLLGLQQWIHPGTTLYRVIGLWCIATLFLLVVWKADGVHRLRDRRLTDANTQ